jgi:hypothetical protein
MTRKPGGKRYKPYQQIKQRWYSTPNPFAGVPADVRRRALFDAAQNARKEFADGFPKLRDWFVDFDPLYILSFCVFYFLSTPQGVDKEAVDGTVDFGPVHLELLQAFALMGPRTFNVTPLKERASELQTTLKSLTDALIFGNVKATPDMSDDEVKKQVILAKMRVQTLAIRNWAFPDQAVRHLKELFSGSLRGRISASHQGVDIVRLIDGLVRLQDAVNDRLNTHLGRLGSPIRPRRRRCCNPSLASTVIRSIGLRPAHRRRR